MSSPGPRRRDLRGGKRDGGNIKTCVRSLSLWRLLFFVIASANLMLLIHTSTIVWKDGSRHDFLAFSSGGIDSNSFISLEETPDLSRYPPLRALNGKSTEAPNSSDQSSSKASSPLPSSTLSKMTSKHSTDQPPLTRTNVTFCLLIKDDNDILPEWIAYHYHLWNLRNLIVAVDPSSETSPASILQQWKNVFGLEYQILQDSDFLPEFFLQGQYDLVPRMIKFQDSNASKWQDTSTQSAQDFQKKYVEINNHRYRQSKFLQHCARRVQDNEDGDDETASKQYTKAHARWVTHIDTDEYMDLNPTLDISMQSFTGGGHLSYLEKAILGSTRNLPNWPCVSMPRILYGSIEDSESAIETKGFTGWDLRRFETLRWKYHSHYDDKKTNKQPKVIMDVAGFGPINTTRKAFSIHRPSPYLCRAQGQMRIKDYERYPVVVRHYLGSYERYMSRKDPRRTQALYDAQMENNCTNLRDSDDSIHQWLSSFVATYGAAKTSAVLSQYQNGIVGVPSPFISSAARNDALSVAEEQDLKLPLKLGLTLPVVDDSLSVCLLVKDDNDILPEWLAYHHHVLKLRTVIVAVDPDSQTSPASVLEDWEGLMDGIHIWADMDYMPQFFLQGKLDQVPNMNNGTNLTNPDKTKTPEELQRINIHRFRQNIFLTECIKALKAQYNRTWAMHIDTDEYITLHPKIRSQDHWRKIAINPELRKDSLFELLKQVIQGYQKGLSYPCMSLPRLLYGSKEDASGNRFDKLPAGLNGSRFETLRWKYHANYDEDQRLNGKPKTILDLSGLPLNANFLGSSGAYSIHRPALHLCQSDRFVLFEAPHKFPLTIQHYIGSWERYSHRDDARRTRATYDMKASVDAGQDDDWIDSWISSFVREHGMKLARRLLKDYVVEGTDEDFQEDEIDAHAPGSIEAVHDFDTSERTEFSACLLVKDDNEILNEWIAYHYHVLGLRFMIVAVDVKSHTSPTSVLDAWRSFGMQIEEWQDTDFMPDFYFQKAYHLQPRLFKIKKNKDRWLDDIDDPKAREEFVHSVQDHRFRQITFVSACAKRLRDQGRTWMIHIDTDEYIVVNPKLRQEGVFGERKIPIPRLAEESIVPKLLNQMVAQSWDTINYPCISLPRLRFGSVEDGDRRVGVPGGYNESRFETLRWKYHADFQDSYLNKQPKVIMDVSAIPSNDKMFTENRVFSIHRPSQSLCRTQGQMYFEDVEYFPFSVNHYLGTFERFGARDDPRRNRKEYVQKANITARKDQDFWVESWLPSFIETHGAEQVNKLLSDYRSE